MDYASLSDQGLLAKLRELAARERRATAEFVACLAEADRREKAVLDAGYPSLFEFCVRDLRLAESTAYQRVKAARLVRKRPEILSYLASGELNLSNLCLVVSHAEQDPSLIEKIRGKSKREVEALLAAMGGPREIVDRIRLLPAVQRPHETADLFDAATRDSRPPVMPSTPTAAMAPPAAPPRAEFRFTASSEFVASVEKLRSLLWRKHPAGRLEDVLYEAIADYIARRDPLRQGRLTAAASPVSGRSRKIPVALRRAVWRRDGGRCSFVGAAGRCTAVRGIEIDHIVPWALGGRSDDLGNLRLLCRAHNQAERERIFGPSTVPG